MKRISVTGNAFSSLYFCFSCQARKINKIMLLARPEIESYTIHSITGMVWEIERGCFIIPFVKDK